MSFTGRGRLVVLSGPDAGTTYTLDRECTRIGRAPDNDIVLQDPFASRRHAEILWEDGRYRVRDLGSKNGVFLDGQRVQEAWLDDGCVLQLADIQLRFHDPAATRTQVAAPASPQHGLWVDPERREVWVDGRLLDPPLSCRPPSSPSSCSSGGPRAVR
ncbi:MAG: FHA domain-containing protein [Chloroflexi bacterium]|nr:FHA domain-containing protein [Chloroflexota bacterium]